MFIFIFFVWKKRIFTEMQNFDYFLYSIVSVSFYSFDIRKPKPFFIFLFQAFLFIRLRTKYELIIIDIVWQLKKIQENNCVPVVFIFIVYTNENIAVVESRIFITIQSPQTEIRALQVLSYIFLCKLKMKWIRKRTPKATTNDEWNETKRKWKMEEQKWNECKNQIKRENLVKVFVFVFSLYAECQWKSQISMIFPVSRRIFSPQKKQKMFLRCSQLE